MKRKVLISLGVLIVIAVSGGIFVHTGTEDISMGVAVVENFINLEYDKSIETAHNDITEAKKKAEEEAKARIQAEEDAKRKAEEEAKMLAEQKNETNASQIQAEDPTITPDASKAEVPEQPQTPAQSSGNYSSEKEAYDNSSAYAELSDSEKALLKELDALMSSGPVGEGTGSKGVGSGNNRHLNGN